MTRRRTQTEHRHTVEMMDTLEAVQMEMAYLRRSRNIVPDGWDRAGSDAPCHAPKKKMTIRLDADVMDWYRSLGVGYQNRINLVLKAYMHGIIAKHLGEDTDSMQLWMNYPVDPTAGLGRRGG